ncbi:MAG TPA: hypothetical protein VFE47_00255 [Tepidisphaeraceae bacterium]|nr:hypothetical protein [Tepidisphaeraceae bacterium]
MTNESNHNPEELKPVPSFPGQKAVPSWGKASASEPNDARPSPPQWTQFMDSGRKEFCK